MTLVEWINRGLEAGFGIVIAHDIASTFLDLARGDRAGLWGLRFVLDALLVAAVCLAVVIVATGMVRP